MPAFHSPSLVFLLALSVPAVRLAAQTRTCPSFTGTPANVSNDTAPSFEPQVAVRDDGTIAVSWYDAVIRHASSTDGGRTFSPPAAVPSTSGATSPALAADGTTLHLAYRLGAGSSATIVYRKSSDGGRTWATPATVSAGSGASASSARIDAHGGHVYLAFAAIPPGDTAGDVFLATSSDGGATWSSPMNLSQSPGVRSNRPDVGVRRNASMSQEVISTWTELAGTPAVLARKSNDSAATFAAPVTAGPLVTPAAVRRPDLDVDPATGTVVLTWSDIPGPFQQSEVFVTSSLDGGVTFRPPVNVSNDPNAVSRSPVVSIYGERAWIGYEEASAGPFELIQVCFEDLALTASTAPAPISATPGVPSQSLSAAFSPERLVIAHEDFAQGGTASDVAVDTADLFAQIVPLAGTGCPGSRGLAEFRASGSFGTTFTVSVGPVSPMAPGLIGLSSRVAAAPITIAGCQIALAPTSTAFVPVTADVTGAWSATLPGPIPRSLDVFVQGGFAEPAGGITVTRAVFFFGHGFSP